MPAKARFRHRDITEAWTSYLDENSDIVLTPLRASQPTFTIKSGLCCFFLISGSPFGDYFSIKINPRHPIKLVRKIITSSSQEYIQSSTKQLLLTMNCGQRYHLHYWPNHLLFSKIHGSQRTKHYFLHYVWNLAYN